MKDVRLKIILKIKHWNSIFIPKKMQKYVKPKLFGTSVLFRGNIHYFPNNFPYIFKITFTIILTIKVNFAEIEDFSGKRKILLERLQ